MRKVSVAGGVHVLMFTKDVKYTCFYCKLEFPDEGSLATHLTTLKHLGLPNSKFQQQPEFQCMTCGSDIPMNNVIKHACIEKAYKNYWEMAKFIDEFGSPNMCFLCRGMLFETPAHLNAHIIVSHNWSDFDDDSKKNKQNVSMKKKHLNETQCPICLSVFLTKQDLVLHRHAYEDHTPEFGITMLNSLSGFSRAKYGSPNDLKQWISKRIYACHFPNSRTRRYPVTESKHLNRLLPGFSTKSCTETFTSLYSLSSHLCVYHFVDEIGMTNSNYNKLTSNQQRDEITNRLYFMQQEIDLRKRTLIGKELIVEKIPAAHYCLECFRLYGSNFELQVHAMIFHQNMTWNQCSICSYDCKNALGLASNGFDEATSPELSVVLMWNALWNHEKSHLQFFQKLAKNPDMFIPENCLEDFSSDVKPILEPVITIVTRASIENLQMNIPKYIFTEDQIAFFTELGARNVNAQTEYMINEALEEKVT